MASFGSKAGVAARGNGARVWSVVAKGIFDTAACKGFEFGGGGRFGTPGVGDPVPECAALWFAVMYCIRFNTSEQRDQMRRAVKLTPEQAASRHPVPAVTESKLRRLRVLAGDPDFKIRESVGSNRSAPADVLRELACDAEASVRESIARNDSTPPDILRALVSDPSETVRGWLVLNRTLSDDAIETLTNDASEVVRGLVRWRLSVG